MGRQSAVKSLGKRRKALEDATPKKGVYIEIVGYGHGAHEIFAAFDVPMEKIEELDALIKSRPDLFSIRSS